MSIGVHKFEIPHDRVEVTRDMIVIRIPYPPSKIGSFIIPDQSRELAQHNVMVGVIEKMGPLAFAYKGVDEKYTRHRVEIGDWVVIRPFAGTLLQGGKIQSNFGWRYVSTFNDVIGIIPAADMPPRDKFEWESGETETTKPPVQDFNFNSSKAV